jgi:hypothetical protein
MCILYSMRLTGCGCTLIDLKPCLDSTESRCPNPAAKCEEVFKEMPGICRLCAAEDWRNVFKKVLRRGGKSRILEKLRE